MKLDALTALKITQRNPNKRFPDEEDPRFEDGLLFPALQPKFLLEAPARVFTIGSCFARNIELALLDYDDIELPTMSFTVPKSEWPNRPNGLLNQYNTGTTSQRILTALRGGGRAGGDYRQRERWVHRSPAPRPFSGLLGEGARPPRRDPGGLREPGLVRPGRDHSGSGRGLV